MKTLSDANEVEPLVRAVDLDAMGILPRSTAYRLAQRGLIPSYSTGVGLTGVRFRVSEVLAALRRDTKPESTELVAT